MRVRALTIRILRQLRRDKRTLALLIMAPIFVLTLMSFVFNGSDYHPKIGIVNASTSFINKLQDSSAKVKRYDEGTAEILLRSSQLDAVINFKSGIPYIKMEGSDPSKSRSVLMLVQDAIKPEFLIKNPDITYLYGYDDMSAFDNFGPILIGFFVFFFVFLISGVSFLRERSSGTLERLLATPIKRWEVVIGYALGFGIFTIFQSTLIAWYSIKILNIMMVGSFLLVLLVTLTTAMAALTLGTFISAYANNELQMIQFIPIIVVPQIFFSGLFDLSTMSVWLQYFGKFMPLYYSADALREIMIRGKGWQEISFDVFVLIFFCLIFMFANILALKKHRKI